MNAHLDNQHVDLLIKNVHVMTMDDDIETAYGLIENACLAVTGGTITWIGRAAQAPDFTYKHVVDGKGQFLSPGFIDCHTHLIFAGSRAQEFEQRLNGVSYQQIAQQGGGINATVQATRAASEDSLFQSSQRRLQALISEGVTTVEIKSGYGLNTDAEVKMLRVAKRLAATQPITIQTTFLGAHAVPPEFQGNSDAYIDYLLEDTLPTIVDLKLADAVDGFCENIGFSREQIRKIFAAAKQYKLPVKLHAEQLSDQSGAALVAEFGGLSADHLEYLSTDNVQLMAQSGTVAVLLPGAFYTLSETKQPPIDALRKYQVPIAVGSDFNPGTSPLCSLKLMLHMACTQFKLTPEEALKGVTVNAAKALGMSSCGVLKVGYQADLCLWDVTHPAELAYSFGVNPLIHSWQQGKLVVGSV